MNSRSCVCLLILGTLTVAVAYAASIPAWLDDAITEYNGKNPELQIKFVDIKDSFVWYTIPQATDMEIGEVLSRIYALVERHGYEKTADEELVTTGRPPIINKMNTASVSSWSVSGNHVSRNSLLIILALFSPSD